MAKELPGKAKCANCGRSIRYSESKAGLKAKCPNCKGDLVLPPLPPLEPPASPIQKSEPTLADLGLSKGSAKDVYGTAFHDYEHKPEEFERTWIDRMPLQQTLPPPASRQKPSIVWGLMTCMMVGMVGVSGLCAAVLVLAIMTAPKGEPTSNHRRTKAEVIGVRLAPFKSAGGTPTQEIITTWRNVGQSPIRVVYADITLFHEGVVVDDFNYTIYAVFDDEPGIQPGETRATPLGSGFKLHPFQPVDSAEVVITRCAEVSGL